MSTPLEASIISLGSDLYAMKLYWVAMSTLWTYDYLLTLRDEAKYAWRGKKTAVFFLFIMNRYLIPCFIVITLVAYFSDSWTLNVCARYGFMETLETMLLTCTAEVFLTLRIYALTNKHKAVLAFTSIILLWQWAIALYAMSQSARATDQPALLLSRNIVPPLPTLPSVDAYHICISISTLTVTPWVEAYLCLSLVFDAVAFLVILFATAKAMKTYQIGRVMKVIRQDGIMYFFVLFSSNLVWLLLLLHARPGLKFIHNQPAMVISSIMINRITLNLKRASFKQSVITWSVKTFEDFDALRARNDSTLVGSNTFAGQDLEMETLATRR